MMTVNIVEGLAGLAMSVDDLVPLENNPRIGDVDAIARSLARFGQRRPLVARKSEVEGEPHTVIAGNHTLEAAKALGWTEVAVLLVTDDAETAKGFALADNRISDLGTFDPDLLVEMLESVSMDSDLLLATGYDIQDLEAMTTVASEWDFESHTYEARDPNRGDNLRGSKTLTAVSVTFVFGDLRSRVPREIYNTWVENLMGRVGNNKDEASIQALVDLGFNRTDVQAGAATYEEIEQAQMLAEAEGREFVLPPKPDKKATRAEKAAAKRAAKAEADAAGQVGA